MTSPETKIYSTPAGFELAPDDNCLTLAVKTIEKRPSAAIFSRPAGHDWQEVSGKEFIAQFRAVAKGLVANGVEQGDRVVLMADSSYEWALMDFAIMAAGAVSVPVYPSSSASQVQWIVEDSGAKIVVCDTEANRALYNNLVLREDGTAPLVDSPTQLKRSLAFATGGVGLLVEDGRGVGDDVIDERIANISHDDLMSIVYTSGTTGRPKGCLLTHLVWASQAMALLHNPIGSGLAAKPGTRYVTILPLAHVLARAVHLAATIGGAHQTHWSDTRTIPMALQRFEPYMILAVPRVYEKVRDGAYNKAADSSPIAARLFLQAEKAAIAYSKAMDTPEGPSKLQEAKHKVFDKLVYKKLRDAVGGKAVITISGGSAISAQLLHFFRGLGLTIYEGYGLTETAAAATVNNPEHIRIGTVGQPNNGYSVKINEDGEICFKGDGVIKGYWNNQKATDEAIIDGWFVTGDLGEIDEDGYVKITGRKKDLIVTAGGKNVSPGPMEDILRSHPLISQALVVGDGKPFVGVLVTLDDQEVARWKKEHSIPEDMEIGELVRKSAELRAEVQDAVNEVNRSVSQAEQIKKFRILDQDLTEESGEMTATMKIKRNVVFERYKKQIDRLYR
ncbi:long-chain fatty acid--CoA ligase [Corynebacterium sp. CCUG 65737]|uniref:AMP-dependent synthetase/ligase n=1 Tax=Corynebacterium sp. CCUG 65737 TaxID=2823889 RepID=UPI00210F0961|nr:long-chain fatty acid--CoA ligase [Corynebacterium sp. CCUG 65737]MCQ4618382.1 long-chain fatty acid--CoA ligase [Corynebacterium pseudogenitalium]MCQ4627756.1 long-chain fatty acid--CoA ligase [Corynebacterium sp. CCUG 65737]